MSIQALTQTELLMAQALESAAAAMSELAAKQQEVADVVTGAKVILAQVMTGASTISALNIYNPAFWPLVGARVAGNVAHLVNGELMVLPGELRVLGVYLLLAPGVGNSRYFQLTKNEVPVASAQVTYTGTQVGYKTLAAPPLPLTFVAGDRIGLTTGYGGAPGDTHAIWAAQIRWKSS